MVTSHRVRIPRCPLKALSIDSVFLYKIMIYRHRQPIMPQALAHDIGRISIKMFFCFSAYICITFNIFISCRIVFLIFPILNGLIQSNFTSPFGLINITPFGSASLIRKETASSLGILTSSLPPYSAAF